MADDLNILYTPDAVDDLDSIFSYISDDNRSAALRLLDRIEETIRKLSRNPRIGTVLAVKHASQLENGYRYFVVSPYLIFYRFGDGALYISRILHHRQEWMQLLFDNMK